MLSTAAAPVRAAAADTPCGGSNQAVATTIPIARDRSLFVLAYEAQASKETFTDGEGRNLVFVGNAFLIDILDAGQERIGYFATAKHNLAAACTGARKLAPASLPKVRLVAANRASVATTEPSAAQCDRLIKATETAGNGDVVFNPDFTVLSGPLPGGTFWKPILIGSVGTASTGGVVEHMDRQLTARPAIAGNLPTASVKPEHMKYRWIRVIAGENDHGVSGSAFITTLSNGLPVALGTVTHSFPPGRPNSEDDPNVMDESVLSRQELENLVVATVGDLSGTGYSLISTFDVFEKEYDPAPPSAKVAQIFKAAEGTGFRDMSRAEEIRALLGGNSAIVYIRRECEALTQGPNLWLKYTFCQKVLYGSTMSQCLYAPEQYIDYAAALVRNAGATFRQPSDAVKAANEAREILGAAGPKAANGVVPILQTALTQSLGGKTMVRPEWDSAAVFDLAKAERSSGGAAGDYLNRLRQAIQIDPSNTLAKRAFVDAVAQNGRADGVMEARRYLNDLVLSKQMNRDRVVETEAALMRSFR